MFKIKSMQNRKPEVSAIVVTYLRPDELRNCIQSINEQSYLPTEIIVIDNGASVNDSAEKISKELSGIVPVYYFPNSINSLPTARNMGVARSKEKYVLLVDDDVRLASNYIENIIEIFQKNEEVVGVQGYIAQVRRPMPRELLHRIFGHYYLEKNNCRVLQSISTTYPCELTKTSKCEWMSGSNQLYRREVLEEILWDEKLMKYADGEDLDHSYRVYRSYPGKLLITPYAPVYHSEAILGRTIKKELIVMREVYGWYLNNKLFPFSLSAKIIFLWSRIGRLIFSLLILIKKRDGDSLNSLNYLVSAYYFVWMNRIMVASGDLESFNKKFKISKDLK
jgi:GT2 family glycosyltransferase